MVGLVNVGFINVLDPEIFERKVRFAQPSVETSNYIQLGQTTHTLPFSVTLGKTEEIQQQVQEIREIWSEGYNYRTKRIKKIEPLLTGLLQLNDFISSYWNYFTPEEKNRLVTQAYYLKLMSRSNYYANFNNLIRVILSQKFLITIRLIIKYRKEIWNNPKNHIFIQFNQVNKLVAERIIDLDKKDFELASFRQINLDKINARWEKQGQQLIDSMDSDVEIEKTSDDLEWEKHLFKSHEYLIKQESLFEALPKEKLLPYKDQYVFFEEGEIKDYDNNHEDLVDRVYETVGYRAIYITKVDLEN